MNRAKKYVDANTKHIFFKNDSLVFQCSKTKGHQNGENHVGFWNIYFNSHETYVCDHLSLARYILPIKN